MAERFERLLYLEAPLWCDGSPIIIEKGALLRDAAQGQNLLQLRVKNIQERQLSGLVIEITLKDIKGESIGTHSQSFLDLSAPNGSSFGESTPIYLEHDNARRFSFRVADAVFSDGTTWSSPEEMLPVTPAEPIETLGELSEQFVAEMTSAGASVPPLVLPTDRDGLWFCTCGALNDQSNSACSTCGRNRQAQTAATDPQFLAQRRQEVAQAREEDRAAKAERTRRVRGLGIKGAAVLVGLVIVALLLNMVILPAIANSNAYAEASTLLEDGKYEQAAEAFTALGDYKDSADKAEHAASFGAALPDVLGLTLEEAKSALASVGLSKVEVEYDETSEEKQDTILAQTPSVGQYASGEPIALTVAGYPPVEIPDVVGLSKADAEVALADAGLTLGEVTESYDESMTVGLVISQQPASADEVPERSSIALVLSKGREPRAIPDVVGKTQADATSALEAIGFVVQVKTADSEKAKGTVLSQDPKGGTELQPGSTVTITVSTGVALVKVPNVFNYNTPASKADYTADITSNAELKAAFARKGLKVTFIGVYSLDFPNGVPFLRQKPAAGSMVPKGSTVTVWYSTYSP